MRRGLAAWLLLSVCLAPTCLAQAVRLADGKARGHRREITISDVLNHRWTNELVTYRLAFPARQASLSSIRVYDADKAKELPFQLSALTYHSEKRQHVRAAKVSFFIDELPAMGTRRFLVLWDAGKFPSAQRPAPSLKDSGLTGETAEVTNGLFGVRLAGGEKRFDPPVDAASVPGPIRGLRGPDGAWRATSRFRTGAKLLGWKGELLEAGPLWKLYRTRFDFEGGRYYELELKMVAGLPYAYVTERNNFRIRLEQMPHPLCDPGGRMSHGKCYTRWGVADQLRILLRQNFDPDVAYSPETFSYHFARDPMKHDQVKVWTAVRPVFPSIDAPWMGAFSSDPRKNDLIAIVGRDAAHWEYPDTSTHPHHLTPGVNAEIYFVDEPKEHAYFRIPVARAVRHWLLAVGDKRQWTEEKHPGHRATASRDSSLFPYLAHLRATVCDLPLDKVKDWHLDWKQQPPKAPRLYFTPREREALLQRIRSHEPFKPYLKRVRAALEGNVGVGRVGTHIGGRMVDVLLRVGYAGFVQSISIVRPQRGVAESLDFAAGKEDPQQLLDKRREMAFLNSVITDGDYWQYAWNPGRTSYLANFGSDLYIAAGLTALVLPDHPNSKHWLDYALAELGKELRHYISPDGAGEENVANYYVWTWGQLSPFLHALKRNGIFDASKHPRYQAACRFWIEVITPPQPALAAYWSKDPAPREQCVRRLPPYGDHGFNNKRFHLHAANAAMLKDANPKLAAESAWAWREACGATPHPWAVVPQILTCDPTIKPRAPELRSRRLRGFGAILRNHFPSDKETYLSIKCSRIYSHHNPDEGAVHVFLRGVPVLLDALHPDREPREEWHSLVSFAGGAAHRRGDVTSFWASPLADSVTADIPPGNFMPGSLDPGVTKNGWRRHILLVKSPTPDVPDYFAFYDKVLGPEASQLNLTALSGKPKPGAGARANRLLLPPIDSPNHGVACEIIFLTPASPRFTTQPLKNRDVKGGEYAWAVHARQPAGKDWAWVLYSRERDMAPPKLKMLAPPHAFRLEHPGRTATDYVVSAAGPVSARTRDFRFTGRAGVARLRDGRVAVALVDGVEIRLNEIGVFGKGSIYFEQAADGFNGLAEGPEQKVCLFLGADWTSDLLLTLNGRSEKRNSPNGILWVTLPRGRSDFSIRVP